MAAFLFRPVQRDKGVELADGAPPGQGNFSASLPALGANEEGRLTIEVGNFVVGGSSRSLCQRQILGFAGVVRLNGGLTQAWIANDAGSNSTFQDITPFRLTEKRFAFLTVRMIRNAGDTACRASLLDETGLEIELDPATDTDGSWRSVGPYSSNSTHRSAYTIYSVRVEYPTTTRFYPVNEGSGDTSNLQNNDTSLPITWTNQTWVNGRRRSTVAGIGATGQVKRSTVFADRIR